MLRGLLIAACLVAIAGCSRHDAAAAATGKDEGCVAAGENLAAVAAQNLLGLEGRQKDLMQAQVRLVRDRFVAACTRQAWPAEVRTCLASARDVQAFDACADALLPAPSPAAGWR